MLIRMTAMVNILIGIMSFITFIAVAVLIGLYGNKDSDLLALLGAISTYLLSYGPLTFLTGLGLLLFGKRIARFAAR